MYPKILKAILSGEKVTIEYTTIINLLEKPLSNASTDDVILTKTVMDNLSEIKGEMKIIRAKMDGMNFQ